MVGMAQTRNCKSERWRIDGETEQNGTGRHPSLWGFVFEFDVLIFARGRLTSTFLK
jgi:hypothetical protein